MYQHCAQQPLRSLTHAPAGFAARQLDSRLPSSDLAFAGAQQLERSAPASWLLTAPACQKNIGWRPQAGNTMRRYHACAVVHLASASCQHNFVSQQSDGTAHLCLPWPLFCPSRGAGSAPRPFNRLCHAGLAACSVGFRNLPLAADQPRLVQQPAHLLNTQYVREFAARMQTCHPKYTHSGMCRWTGFQGLQNLSSLQLWNNSLQGSLPAPWTTR